EDLVWPGVEPDVTGGDEGHDPVGLELLGQPVPGLHLQGEGLGVELARGRGAELAGRPQQVMAPHGLDLLGLGLEEVVDQVDADHRVDYNASHPTTSFGPGGPTLASYRSLLTGHHPTREAKPNRVGLGWDPPWA